MAILLTWEDMLKANKRIREEGLKLTSVNISDNEYKDPIDKFKEKIKRHI